MKRLAQFVLSVLVSCSAQASFAYETDLVANDKTLSVLLGFPAGTSLITDDAPGMNVTGFVGLGADFEMRGSRGLGYGAFLRLYNSADNIGNTEMSINLFSLGAFVSAHLRQNDVDFYFSPGFGFTNGEVKVANIVGKTGLVLSPSLAIGALYKVNSRYSVGVENMRIISTGSLVTGTIVDDWMLKAQIAL